MKRDPDYLVLGPLDWLSLLTVALLIYWLSTFIGCGVSDNKGIDASKSTEPKQVTTTETALTESPDARVTTITTSFQGWSPWVMGGVLAVGWTVTARYRRKTQDGLDTVIAMIEAIDAASDTSEIERATVKGLKRRIQARAEPMVEARVAALFPKRSEGNDESPNA